MDNTLFVPTEGPVKIGMSLDIASIDAISEINMVRILFMFITSPVNFLEN